MVYRYDGVPGRAAACYEPLVSCPAFAGATTTAQLLVAEPTPDAQRRARGAAPVPLPTATSPGAVEATHVCVIRKTIEN